jgi:hypothetical protein
MEGMHGSLAPAPEERNPAGYVAKHLSDDGSHLLFGSKAKFEQTGEEGEVSIYDRNLNTDTTQVVSTLPNGETMDGSVGESGALDISADGSRVVVGERISTDSAGNEYWHPYMHMGNSELRRSRPGSRGRSSVQRDG